MKKLLFLVAVAAALTACKKESNDKQQQKNLTETPTAAVNTETMDWLLGDWKRTNDKDGRETFESWRKVNQSKYEGIGFTLSKGDTLSKEHMRLEQVNGLWSLAVKTGDNQEETAFKVAELTKESFVCINETHDFPTHITYNIDGDKLRARVSNAEMTIDFDFVKK